MQRQPIVVLKFGSSVLRSEADLPRAVHEIYRWLRTGHSVVAVVSAFGNTTDELLASARRYCERPQEQALALLLSTGEKRAAALLSLVLDRAGIPSTALDPARLGLRTNGRVLNAEPVRLNVPVVRRALEHSPVVVVPGFIGQMQDGRTSLLGRGGSDLTALFLAAHLRAQRCRLLKDVAGVYDHDPHAGDARRYRTLTWQDALAMGGRIIQSKALRFAREHNLEFEVGGVGSEDATLVGADQTAFASSDNPGPPVRVALLGLGTVGYGVYQELKQHTEKFEIVGIAVRTLDRPQQEVERELLCDNIFEVLSRDCDVVIETIGGCHPAAECISAALATSKHVITANKAVLANNPQLHNQARQSGSQLLFSAAVGGALPVLEVARQLSRECGIRSIEGVLNGTTNFILHELARGVSFDDALALAQSCGLAEADPTADLDGSDVVAKLVLIAHCAFGTELQIGAVQRTGIAEIDPRHVFDLSKSGHAVRLVGSIKKQDGVIVAEVKPMVVDSAHPFAQAHREDNCVIFELENNERRTLRGKGAGRWPTAEAVFADLLTLAAERTTNLETAEAVAS